MNLFVIGCAKNKTSHRYDDSPKRTPPSYSEIEASNKCVFNCDTTTNIEPSAPSEEEMTTSGSSNNNHFLDCQVKSSHAFANQLKAVDRIVTIESSLNGFTDVYKVGALKGSDIVGKRKTPPPSYEDSLHNDSHFPHL
ncbi:hypothetical protein HELRODRAFT_161565 [Helobdella robusta]|uniref:Uncharacterized protein n=1 Tax=Helobdella robusta TaxID=6412 RepID=T1ERM3_HELRO|nr:hypothetical protein HELRODRAFT_161565 [Helobdella robusta]ESO02310.1 hypothetical protein HELRODRAFT_161565 [Helobdella robusta]